MNLKEKYRNLTPEQRKSLAIAACFLSALVAMMIVISRCSRTSPAQETPQQEAVKKISRAEVAIAISNESKLYTAEVEAHKTMHYTSDNAYNITLLGRTSTVKVPFGHMEAFIPVTAKYKAHVDLALVDSTRIRIVGDTLVQVILPDPVIEQTAVTIDHANEKINTEMFAHDMDDATYQKIVRKAKDDIWTDIGDDRYYDIIKAAQTSAAETIIPILHSLGFTKVEVAFRKDINTTPPQKFLRRQKE